MNSISFDFADNLNTPIMITSVDGKVIYKNHCAKKCVKSPRIAANINKHINKRIPLIKSKSGIIRIISITNYNTIHKRAFVCRVQNGNEEIDLWFFGSSLQIPDMEHLEEFDLVKLEKCLDGIVKVLKTLDFKANRSSIDRYIQIGTPFLESMRYLRYSEDPLEKFRIYRVLESIQKKSYELASLYSVHIDVDISGIDPENYHHISFQSFSSLYVQALMTVLKISNYSLVSVICTQQEDAFNIRLTAPIRLLKSIPKNGSILFALASAFPDEYFNILFMEQYALMKEYKIRYNIIEKDSMNYLELDFMTSLSQQDMQLNEETAFISDLNFTKLEEKIHTHISAMFSTLKHNSTL